MADECVTVLSQTVNYFSLVMKGALIEHKLRNIGVGFNFGAESLSKKMLRFCFDKLRESLLRSIKNMFPGQS